MATLVFAPAPIAYQQNTLLVGLSTTLADNTRAYYQISITSAPSAGQTLRLDWDGGTITYTVGAVPLSTGLTWPTALVGETMQDYADRVADFLREREDVSALFVISREADISGDEIIRITRRSTEIFNLSVHTDTLAGIAVTATPKATTTTPVGLRALVEVYRASDHLRLLSGHATYPPGGSEVAIDISPAFAALAPQLPPSGTINPAVSNFETGVAESHLETYYFRYADKYGAPPLAERLLRSVDNYNALLGGRSLASGMPAIGALLHNYRRADGEAFAKPVSPTQPDWLYWLPDSDLLDGPTYYIDLLVHWSDGTNSQFLPFGSTPRTYVDGKVNWLKSGYQQLRLQLLTPPVGTATDAIIVGYDFRLTQPGGSGYVLTAKYEVEHLSAQGQYYLLYDNGVGGLETCWLHGAGTESYNSSREQWQRIRTPETTAAIGEIASYGSEGNPVWELSSGYYDHPYYLTHLRQLMHATGVWLIDVPARKFLSVVVESTEMAISTDDQNLLSTKLKIRAAWIDRGGINT